MKMFALVCALVLTGMSCAQAAKLYKWTDSQGNPVYSDTPRPGAQEIDIPTEPAGIQPVAPAEKAAPSAQPTQAAAPYHTLIIASPANEQIVKNTVGVVDVSLALEPALRVREGHVIRLRLDGQPVEAKYTGAEMSLTDVSRGEHKLEAEVVDSAGTVLISSANVTFYVQQASRLAPRGPNIYPPIYPRPTPR